jgi:hypothetical protein
MKGADKDLLEMCIKALRNAHDDINSLTCDYAIENVGIGKEDTCGIDQSTEEVIKHYVKNYDPTIVLVTEETGKLYHGKRGLEPTQVVLVSDPTDRSIKMREFLQKMINQDSSYLKKDVNSVIKDNFHTWESEFGDPTISGASGNITAIKDRRILFNVMVNYITGELFVSSPLGNRYGKIEEPMDYDSIDFQDVSFPSETGKKGKYATFLRKKGYQENLEKCHLGLNQEDCVDPWAPGPTRILQLSSLYKGDGIDFILSNGEKIGEWIGWLSWMKYSRDDEVPDENSLEAYRIFFEDPRTKELVLVAPGPHYSIFRDEGNETVINLDMMFQLNDPSHYRETFVVVPVHNTGIISRVKALGKYCHELKP